VRFVGERRGHVSCYSLNASRRVRNDALRL
jgi:hypothetical protein